MTDFTLQELYMLSAIVTSYSCNPGINFDIRLLNKIHSLIDNYCQIKGHAYEEDGCTNCGAL